MNKEIWKPIPSTEGLYEASSSGEIRSVKRATTKGIVLKQYRNPHNGYHYVSICVRNVSKSKRVHVLVAEAFFGERPISLQVNHIDGNKSNNRVENLEYCTKSQNMQHAYTTGLEVAKGRVVIDLESLEVFKSATDAARSVGSSKGEMVMRVCRGKRSHYRNHHFALYEDYLNGTIPPFSGKFKKKGCLSLWQ